MANIQQIRGINKLAKTYMWEVDILGLSTGTLSNLSAYAKTVSIPQQSVETIIINHKGGKTHHAGRDASGHTTTITFWDDQDMTITKFMNDWISLCNSITTGAGSTRDIYGAQMVIRMKDDNDQSVYGKISLSNVFPVDVSDISLSYDTSDAIEVSVTFSFDDRVIEKV